MASGRMDIGHNRRRRSTDRPPRFGNYRKRFLPSGRETSRVALAADLRLRRRIRARPDGTGQDAGRLRGRRTAQPRVPSGRQRLRADRPRQAGAVPRGRADPLPFGPGPCRPARGSLRRGSTDYLRRYRRRSARGSLPQKRSEPPRCEVLTGHLRAARRRGARAEAGRRAAARERTALPGVCLAQLRRHVAHRIRKAHLHRPAGAGADRPDLSSTAISPNATMPWPASSASSKPPS